jgi:hypothetical protein
MPTEEFIIALFCRIDDAMTDVHKHSQASLYPSETVTLAVLFALKGVNTRAFYRWVWRDWRGLFPRLPERTRLFRLFRTHQEWANRFMEEPSLLGVIDTYGIEFIHPFREGRKSRDGVCRQIGKKGLSNRRWIVGGKLCFLLNQRGLIVDWDCATANVYDAHFHPLIEQVKETTVVLADGNFHKKAGNPENMKLCPRGHWNDRMVVETVFSMLTTVCHLKKMRQRVWVYFQARLAYTMAAFNLLAQWNGMEPDKDGFIHLSIAEMSL